MSAQEFKEQGNNYFKNKDYENAIKCFSEAIRLDPNDHIHYSNRSASYLNLNRAEEAMKDADECIRLKPEFAKGYHRRGLALVKLDRVDEAIDAYNKGLQIDPNNQPIKDAYIYQVNFRLKDAESSKGFFSQEQFGKLRTDPRTSKYMSDPQFVNLLTYAMKDQKMLIQLMQQDPRFMDVFTVLTGIDLSKASEDAATKQKEKEEKDKQRKQKEEEDRIKAEAEKNERQEREKWENMSNEEKQQEAIKKQAEELKLKGNEAFKQRNLDAALDYYNQAQQVNPSELSINLNKAGVYHELKQFDKVIEECQYVVDNTFDFIKKSRAYGRMGYAFQELGDYDKAISCFENSLLENTDPRIKDALRFAQREKQRIEAERYINPELAEESNNKANEFYKGGKYPEALKEYNEAIKRNPESARYYSNRAACFIKLMGFNDALKDCDKALTIDPNFLRAIQRKATCHIMMKELHKAMDTYEKGLKLFPEDKELKDGYYKVVNMINNGGDQDQEERVKHAYADPEIQRLLVDPRIQQLFKDLKENPRAANDAIMKDEFISSAFKKLIAAGIIKTG